MSKRKSVIDDRKPSILPKIGSAVIAVGSLASVAAVASPNLAPLAQTRPAASTDVALNTDSQTGQTITDPSLPTTEVCNPTAIR